MNEAQKQTILYARQHRIYERRIYPIFLRALRAQIQPVIDWFSVNPTDYAFKYPPLNELVNKDVFRLPMLRAYEMIGQLSAKREYYYMREMDGKGILDFLVDKWRAIFAEYALNYAYRIENELSETTKEEIRIALQYAYENGYNADKTAGYIRKRVYNEISRARAVLIARTEATTASNLGKRSGAGSWLNEQGQRGYKQWLGREDSRERHSHRELNDKIIPLEQQWELVDENGQIATCQNPGDVRLPARERCNCRCTFLVLSERRYLRLLANR